MWLPRLALAAAAMLAAVPAAAATILVDSGTRIQTIAFTNGIFGQSFLAPGTDLQSIGVQFATLNPAAAQDSVTFALREGVGLSGTVLASSTFTPTNVGRDDPKVFTDIDFTGITLVAGAAYTFTLVNNGSGARNGVVFGPQLINPPFGTEFGPDAYADGGLLFTGSTFSPCAALDRCDLNFRVTATGAVIPEPASWAMMIAGFGLVGGVLRRRTAQTA
jgi:hypothetical protein